MLNIRTEYSIDTNFNVQSRNISNFDASENMYLDGFVYINGSKLYPGESSFIFHSKNVAVIKVITQTFSYAFIIELTVYWEP